MGAVTEGTQPEGVHPQGQEGGLALNPKSTVHAQLEG